MPYPATTSKMLSKERNNRCGLCFATFFNQVLNRSGIVDSRWPLPVYVNEYSVTRPLWAHFFTVIHVVMAAGLFAGLGAVSGTIQAG